MTAQRIGPGPRNSIADVPGIRVGHAEAPELTTGVTAILPEAPCVAAADLRGGGTATRAVDAMAMGGAVGEIDAVVLSGGSSFGLDAAGGAMDWLAKAGRGFAVGPARVPIVPSAIIFDLLTGGPKAWDRPPYWDLGREAVARAAEAGTDFALGNAGAGLGATAGPLKGGVGTASFRVGGVTLGVLAVANPLGSAVIPGTATFWAWMLEQTGEFGGQTPPAGPLADLDHRFPFETGANTTLAVVATDAALTREEALRVAIMAQDGFARALRPVHAPLDGDTVFVLSTGRVALGEGPGPLSRLGMLAADCTARAITRGVFEAASLAGFPSYKSLLSRANRAG